MNTIRLRSLHSLTSLVKQVMLGSHYGFLPIDSKSHRQKGRSRVDTCLQKLVLENNLRGTWWSKHGKRDAWNIYLCLDIEKYGKRPTKMKFYKSIDKNLREVEHVLFHRQVSHRLSSTFIVFVCACRYSSFCRWLSESIDENLQCEPSIGQLELMGRYLLILASWYQNLKTNTVKSRTKEPSLNNNPQLEIAYFDFN